MYHIEICIFILDKKISYPIHRLTNVMYGSLYYSTTVKKYLIQIIFTPGENESDMEEELRLIVLYLYEVTRQITIQMIPLKILT